MKFLGNFLKSILPKNLCQQCFSLKNGAAFYHIIKKVSPKADGNCLISIPFMKKMLALVAGKKEREKKIRIIMEVGGRGEETKKVTAALHAMALFE